jgi:hypothetical protein
MVFAIKILLKYFLNSLFALEGANQRIVFTETNVSESLSLSVLLLANKSGIFNLLLSHCLWY